MKQCILSLFLISLFSCSKDHTPTLLGKWRIAGYVDCTGGGEINDTKPSLHFTKNGEFSIDTSNLYPFMIDELKGLDRFLVRHDSVLIYKQNSNDSTFFHYYEDNELWLSFGYVAYKFSH